MRASPPADFRASDGTLRPPHAARPTETLEQRLARVEEALATSPRGDRLIGDMRGELAEVASAAERNGARMMHVAGEIEKRIDRVEADVRGFDLEGLAARWRSEREAFETEIRTELAAIARERQPGESDTAAGDVRELAGRLDELVRDRVTIAAELLRVSDSWAAEREALHERIAELADRIATAPDADLTDEELPEWPSTRAYNQLRIAVEGLRMRLAYHEKEVAELAGGRGLNERIEEINDLLKRLETAELSVRGERDSVLDQVDRLASRVDYRLQQLETPASAADAESA